MSRTVRRIVRGMRSRESQPRAGGATKGADPRRMRAHNRLLVLNCVREHGPIARVAIAQRTGLSRTSVSSIMHALLAEGLVREGDPMSATSAGGRRAILIHFNAAAGYILGVDMGRTHLTLLLTDLAAQVVARRAGAFALDRGPEACLSLLLDELNCFLAEQQVDWTQVIGIGLGMPGPMDVGLQRLVSPPRMPGWNDVDVRHAIAAQVGVPIYVDNDANMGALGESRFGAGRGISDLAYIKIGTGIGGALVIGGQVYRGSRGSAGEIGHVTIDENGPVCSCGNRGCLEALACAEAIVADARAGVSLRLSSPLAGQMAGALDALPHPDVADVVRAALAGDPASRAAIQRAGEHVGVALAGLVNLTNPSLILVDGGLAHAGDLLLDPVRRAVAARSLAIASRHARIVVGELHDNAIALGGVATVTDAAFVLSDALIAQRPGQVGGPLLSAFDVDADTSGSFAHPPRAARDPPDVAPVSQPP